MLLSIPKTWRSWLVLLLAVVLAIGWCDEAEAKRRRRSRASRAQNDTRSIRGKKIKKQRSSRRTGRGRRRYIPAPDMSRVQGDGSVFIPQRELSLIAEDTSTIMDGDIEVVEQEEEVKVDSSWIKIASYFSLWDTRRVNPYQIDRNTLEEPVKFVLYDSTKGLNTSMPLRRTKLNSKYGYRHPRFHYGVDLELDTWDTIKASFDGIVRIVGWDGGGYGNFVVLRHFNGLETLYGHMVQTQAEVGALVKAGDLIGFGGSTGRSSGPHLHYELRYQGNAFNPEEVYDFSEPWSLKGSEFTLYPESFSLSRRSSRKATYVRVRSGQTLSAISRKYHVSVNSLRRMNGIRGNNVQAGQRIRIR